MAKEALLQIRINEETKRGAEALFESMGSSLPEAVRVFITQSVIRQAIPFTIIAPPAKKRGAESLIGIASKYADPAKVPLEQEAFGEAMEEKYGKAH